jgi:hypothetical protein
MGKAERGKVVLVTDAIYMVDRQASSLFADAKCHSTNTTPNHHTPTPPCQTAPVSLGQAMII